MSERYTSYVKDREVYLQVAIEGLLSVRSQLKVAVHQLSSVHCQGLGQKETGLVPMRGRSSRARL